MIAQIYGADWREMAEINGLENPSRIYRGQVLCVELKTGTVSPVIPPTGGTFTVFAVEAVEDEEVTIQTLNAPANVRFDVLMGRMGTRGVNGVKVGSLISRSGGAIEASFDIPFQMRDRQQVAIRLQSSDGRWVAYNWFYNATLDGSEIGGDLTGIATFGILEVFEGDEVTIKAKNFPKDAAFDVILSERGDDVEDGYWVDEVFTGKGNFKATFDIPRRLRDKEEIAIYLVSQTSDYTVYNWFVNADTW
jgi:hypothetical protein